MGRRLGWVQKLCCSSPPPLGVVLLFGMGSQLLFPGVESCARLSVRRPVAARTEGAMPCDRCPDAGSWICHFSGSTRISRFHHHHSTFLNPDIFLSSRHLWIKFFSLAAPRSIQLDPALLVSTRIAGICEPWALRVGSCQLLPRLFRHCTAWSTLRHARWGGQ